MAITLASTVVPGGSSFPIVNANDIKGGLLVVNTSSDLSTIASAKRDYGMLVYVKDEDTYYQYTSNDIWDEYSGSGSGILLVDTLDEIDNIKTNKLQEGALCFVSSMLAYYSYVPSSNSWVHYKTGFTDDIIVSSTAPLDTSAIWVDTAADILVEDFYTTNLVNSLLQDIRDLLIEINKFKYMYENQINSGNFNNNTSATLGWVETPDEYITDDSSVIFKETPGFSLTLNNLPFIAILGLQLQAFITSVNMDVVNQPNVENASISLNFFGDDYSVSKNASSLKNEVNLKSTATDLVGFGADDVVLTLQGSYTYVDMDRYTADGSIFTDDQPRHTAPLEFTAIVGWGDAYTYEVNNWEYNSGTLPLEINQHYVPNVTHICIKAGLKAEMQENKAYFLDNELLWCTDTHQLYIKTNGMLKLVAGGSNGTSGDISGGDNTGIMNDIDYLNISTYLNVTTNASIGGTLEATNVSTNSLYAYNATIANLLSASSLEVNYLNVAGGAYQVRVKDDGSVTVYPWSKEVQSLPAAATQDQSTGMMATKYAGSAKAAGAAPMRKLYINAVFCGGEDADEHSYRRCSHNYIEIANHDKFDKSLNGLSIAYCTTAGEWSVLPLSGVIKKGSTYLIRGAQCSVMDSNYTTIKVNSYDIEWPNMKFSESCSSFYLFIGNAATMADYPTEYYNNPAKGVTGTSPASMPIGYIEVAGFTAGASITSPSYELTACTNLGRNRLMYKYYQFDPTSQSDKLTTLTSRKNGTFWDYIDLDKANHPLKNAVDYGPKASNEGKNIYTMKTHFDETKPNYVNCTFGRQATIPVSTYYEVVNNKEIALDGATRCFTWISVGYYDEYIWIRKQGQTSWSSTNIYNNTYECGIYGNADGGMMPSMDNQSTKIRATAYNRIHMEAVDGTNFTTHKAVVKNILDAGTYEYCVGRDLNGYVSDVYTFTVKTDTDVSTNGFNFVLITDQQGFNWNEYEMHRMCVNYIATTEGPSIDFTMNTGDMTQDGNRISEWLDYYNGRDALKNFVEMPVIGNNDLGPGNLYNQTEGTDAEKINYNQYRWFYTFEADEENPPMFTISDASGNTVDAWVDSMYSYNYGPVHFICMNSEVVDNINGNVASANVIIYGLKAGTEKLLMPHIRRWAYADMVKVNKDKSANNPIKWRIAACHDAPFTLLTWSNIRSYFMTNASTNTIEWHNPKGIAGNRSGSHLNYAYDNKYWGESTSDSSLYDPFDKFWFSRFCQETGIRLCIGGHKHTHAVQKPMYEQIKTDGSGIMCYQPIIPYTTAVNTWSTYYNTMEEDPDNSELYKYPSDSYSNWAQSSEVGKILRAMSKWWPCSKITAPAYITCQATGYKHKSNKEMPCQYIPWEFQYVAFSDNKPTNAEEKTDENVDQARPYYVKYEISNSALKYVSHPLIGLWSNNAKGSGFNFNKYPAQSAVREYTPTNLYPSDTDSTTTTAYKKIILEYATLDECASKLKAAVPYYASDSAYINVSSYTSYIEPEFVSINKPKNDVDITCSLGGTNADGNNGQVSISLTKTNDVYPTTLTFSFDIKSDILNENLKYTINVAPINYTDTGDLGMFHSKVAVKTISISTNNLTIDFNNASIEGPYNIDLIIKNSTGTQLGIFNVEIKKA